MAFISVIARQRRRSGDDALSASQGVGGPPAAREAPKDRKKDASPGLFESIRPRSKSDAARLANKKPNFMSNIKQAVQVRHSPLINYNKKHRFFFYQLWKKNRIIFFSLIIKKKTD